MPENKDYFVEDLIKSSESILKDLEEIDEKDGLIPDPVEEKIKLDKQKEEINSIDIISGLRTDGYVDVCVSTDEMTATCNFYPPSEGEGFSGSEEGRPIELESVEKILETKGIVTGINWDAVNSAIFKCNTERVPINDVVVAKGRQPKDEIPAHLEIDRGLLENSKKLDMDRQRIDYREISPFILVKKGDILAHVVSKVPGALGETVTEKSVPYKTAKIKVLKPGKNVTLKDGYAIAACDGRFILGEETFAVSEVLEVRGDVDYHTGNINFPGDVVIYGTVKYGFKVKAGGSVYCQQTLDASEVICGGDLTVNYGVIGKNKGVVKVKGNITTKFIENCYMEAGGNINVATSILNSVVHSLKEVVLGEKGIIVGGKIFAANGVEAAQVGTRVGPKTEIHCGIDFSVQQKLEWIRDKNIELALKLRQTDIKIKSTESEELKAKLSQVRDKLMAGIHKLNLASASLVNYLDKNEDAMVKVRRNVFPGVYIEICHISYIVACEMHACMFKLDKKSGRVVIENIKS